MVGVYGIFRADGTCYVGSSADIEARWKMHRWQLDRKRHHSRYLQRSWEAHGADAHYFRVVEECAEADLLAREQWYIDQWRPEFNSAPVAGTTRGMTFTMSDEAKAKMSAWQKGKPKPSSCRPKSMATRARMSAAQKGRVFSDETRAKMSAWQLGRKLPAETGARIAAANTGKKRSRETRIKMGAWQVGRRLSEETRAKISATKLANRER